MRMSQQQADAHQAKHAPKAGCPVDAFEGLEKDLHALIIKECQKRRWFVVHSRTDKRATNQIGCPDLIIAAPNTTYWLEVKRKGGKLSAEQNVIRHCLLSLGQRYATIYSLQQFLDFVDAK